MRKKQIKKSQANHALTRKICRLCKSKKLFPMVDLGLTPLADLFVKKNQRKEARFPLSVSLCKNCFLVQLMYDVNDDLLFGNHYAFYTGGSPSSLVYFADYAKNVLKRFPKQAKRFTLEIASNDGTLLKHFKTAGCKTLGIDPAQNVAAYANEQKLETLPAFFNKENADKIKNNYGKAGVVIANNVIAHVVNPMQFIKNVKTLLDKDGIFIFECQYFPYLLFNNQFDNIYHEHRSFFSLHPLEYALKKQELKIIDIEEHDTQGGSIRVFATHKKNKIAVKKTLKEKIANEKLIGLTNIDTYKGFESRVNYIKVKLQSILIDLKKQGKQVAGYGASAKSGTLLNYCNIGTNHLKYIIDKTPYKIGLYTPGMHIPVVGKEKSKPDYYLLLVWNYASGILQREHEFRKNGGKFIIPFPTPQII